MMAHAYLNTSTHTCIDTKMCIDTYKPKVDINIHVRMRVLNLRDAYYVFGCALNIYIYIYIYIYIHTYTTHTQTTDKHTHTHTHEHLHILIFSAAKRDFEQRSFTVGIGGPVGRYTCILVCVYLCMRTCKHV
jgi:hypothetical protein